MERIDIIDRLMPRVEAPAYLEIGVQQGLTFNKVKAVVKVAVDPTFMFDIAEAKARPVNAGAAFHQVPSDEYFSRIYRDEDKFDLIFIDGLHTFEQTLRDLLNCLSCIKPNGVILVDDVMPATYASSLHGPAHFTRFREATGLADGRWMGDVFKVPFFIKEYLPLYSYATVQENHGQTVLWRARRPSWTPTQEPLEAICRLDYKDVILREDAFNLTPFNAIEALIYGDRA